MRVDEVSIGDYVLNGGEAAALVIIEAVARLLPGRDRQPGVAGRGVALGRPRRAAGIPGLHQAAELAWAGRPGGPVVRPSRQDRRLAPGAGAGPDPRAPAGAGAGADDDELEIQRGDAADAGELYTLQRAAFVAEGRANESFDIPPLTDGLDATEAALARDTVLVARLRGRLVGAVIGTAGLAGAWTIGRLIVAPDLQGRGIGGRLLAEAEAAAPPNRTVATLITGVGSKKNIAFYTRRGYRVVDRTEDSAGVPVVIMEKALS